MSPVTSQGVTVNSAILSLVANGTGLLKLECDTAPTDGIIPSGGGVANTNGLQDKHGNIFFPIELEIHRAYSKSKEQKSSKKIWIGPKSIKPNEQSIVFTV